MATAASIVINDGQGTPVAHTFEVAELKPNVASFEDRVGGIYIGYNRLTIGVDRPNGNGPSSAGRNLKVRIKVTTPKLETVSNNTVSGIAPAPTLSYTPVVDMVVTCPERSTLQDRKDLQAFIKNVLSNAAVTAAFEKYELPY